MGFNWVLQGLKKELSGLPGQADFPGGHAIFSFHLPNVQGLGKSFC